MKSFFIKTVMLMLMLFLCVLYGITMARGGMPQFQGLSVLSVPDAQKQITSLNVSLPKNLDPNRVGETAGSTIKERAEQLENSETSQSNMNLGKSFSNGVTTTFRTAVSVTASMMNYIVNTIF